MSRVLLDQNVPRAIGLFLTGHDVRTAAELGWAEMENGALIKAAHKAGFDLMVTCDRNIRYQQNMSARPIGLVVLSTNHWRTPRESATLIGNVVSQPEPKGYAFVDCSSLGGHRA